METTAELKRLKENNEDLLKQRNNIENKLEDETNK